MRWLRILFSALIITRYVDGNGNGDLPLRKPHSRFIREADDDCVWNLTVTGSGGTLTSPNYPDNYPSNANCRWLLTAEDPNVTLFLRIDTLQLEPETNCKLDYLQVYLGATSLAPFLGPFCGNIHDKVLKTNSSQLLIVFHSDPIYEDKGFSLDYFTEAPGDCQASLTEGSGSLRSPGFPDNYPDNTDCWSLINVSPSKRIELFFDTLDLEFGDNCTFDYVKIFDGATRDSKLLGQVCRQIGPGLTKFQSSSNTMLLHFHSDDSVNKRGYRARYSSIDARSQPLGDCLWESNDSNGTIASPNYPANYPSQSNCSIWLQAPEGQQIFIIFDALQLEMEVNCSYDYLQIKEGSSADSRTIGKYCGRGAEPKNLTSNSNEVQIIFQTDDFGEFSGFKLRYWFKRNTSELEAEEFNKASNTGNIILDNIPQNITLAQGSSHMLKCSTRHPTAKIRWLKDEQFLAGGSPLPGLKLLANNTLWIQRMDRHLSGVYTCAAVSPDETITVNAYILMENTPDDSDSACGIVFLKMPKNSSFAEGELAHLECMAVGSRVQIAWEKDGKTLDLKNHITVVNKGFIFLDNVTLDDAGIYTCVARDDIAKCNKKASALLQVSERAKIEEICGKPKMGQPSNEIPQHGKIVGGHNANKGAYPWQVMLWEPSLKSFCGGSLLNERWIATAAHCFENYRGLRWDRVVIKLGKYDREYEEDQEFTTGIADPSSIVVHPAYSKVTFDNDLALVRLRDHVRFTDYILPICLGDRDLGVSMLMGNGDTSNLRMGTVIGWGKLKEHGPSPRFLQEIRLPVIDQNKCLASTNQTVSRNMFCAGYSQEIIGDSCHGDSGGPFMMSHGGRWYLVGIVSWGEGCGVANKYGFYTRVPNYMSWIKGIMKS